jgi:enoyl-CoA hydratase/carnithine racemase
MQLLLTGDPVDAATALAWGLVNRVVPLAELDAAIAELTLRIGSRSARVIGQGKQAFYRQVDLGLASAYDAVGETMACSLLDPDAHEASTHSSKSGPALG